jgi:hypothetical protein
MAKASASCSFAGAFRGSVRSRLRRVLALRIAFGLSQIIIMKLVKAAEPKPCKRCLYKQREKFEVIG